MNDCDWPRRAHAARLAEVWRGKAASRIELVADDAATYLERCASGTFGGFSLSNILDGAGELYGERLLLAVRHAAAKGAMVVRRSFSEPPHDLQINRAENDRSMLCGVVDVRAVKDLKTFVDLRE